MIIEFVEINVKPKPKRWKQFADQKIRIFQVSYDHKGKTWFQDVSVLPGQEFADDPPTYIYCWLCEKFGSVTGVQIIKEY